MIWGCVYVVAMMGAVKETMATSLTSCHPPCLITRSTFLPIFLLSVSHLLFFLLLCLSGMLAQPSSVGGGPHIPRTRSAGGKKGEEDVWFTKHMRTHTSPLPPRKKILSEASCSRVRRLAYNMMLCQSKHAPWGDFSKSPVTLRNKLKQIFTTLWKSSKLSWKI